MIVNSHCIIALCAHAVVLLQLVNDLRTLRILAEYLLRFDAVTFLAYLENLRATEGLDSIWLFQDAAHTVFEQVQLGSPAHACVLFPMR